MVNSSVRVQVFEWHESFGRYGYTGLSADGYPCIALQDGTAIRVEYAPFWIQERSLGILRSTEEAGFYMNRFPNLYLSLGECEIPL